MEVDRGGGLLRRFQTKIDSGVLGLSFHSKRPWILASLHSGTIQLWDYCVGTMIARFDEHDGPVRTVCFTEFEPLFVSGGDDKTVKVWNYKIYNNSLFTLTGHLGCIRTVQVHHKYPWIVSASDDMTVRIWDWKTRSCISTLKGHTGSVMSATFHPKEDLVLSASLDRTVRVWDVGRNIRCGVKFILEGHSQGVNWASFHPKLPLIVSGGDDCKIKLWEFNGTKCLEMGTLTGKMPSVSCVLFYAHKDRIVSTSQDNTLRVWNVEYKFEMKCFQQCYGIIASHPEIKLLAAGYESGLVVFKLERERPAFSVNGNELLHIEDNFVKCFNFEDYSEKRLQLARTPFSLNNDPRTLSYSPSEHVAVVCSNSNATELVKLSSRDRLNDDIRNVGCSGVVIGPDMFAVLNSSNSRVLVKNFQNRIIKSSRVPSGANALYYGGPSTVLCRTADRVVLFHPHQDKILAELQTPLIKYVVWSNDMELVALISKHALIIASKWLVRQCTLHETVRVKSGGWDDNGVFFYTTLKHLKYCLPNGDGGIIRSLEVPIYISKVKGDSIICLDRKGTRNTISVDMTECLLKVELMKNNIEGAFPHYSLLCGEAAAAYIRQKGPEVAVYFAKDTADQCRLAIESGKIHWAYDLAKKIDVKKYWNMLAVAALQQGNAGIAKDAYERAGNYERLSFLNLITGNLEEMSRIAELSDDISLKFQTALYMGNDHERVKILRGAGLLPEREVPPTLLTPPTPILCAGDWPLHD